MSEDEINVGFRLSAIDCSTSTKYYQLTGKISNSKKQMIKPYFKYYTPEKFKDKENVAGNMQGWMCTEENLMIIKEILDIDEIQEKALKSEPIQDSYSYSMNYLKKVLELDL